MQEVTGSTPVFSTALKVAFGWLFFFMYTRSKARKRELEIKKKGENIFTQ
jgi:hypothetical protein